MKTLQQHVALNASYREQWRAYYAKLTSSDLQEKLQELTKGLDSESRELCSEHVKIAPYLFPHPLLEKVYISDSSNQDFLPAKTVKSLKRAGFFSDTQEKLDIIQRELDLPIEPLPELLMHSGLKYLPKQAKSLITDRSVIDGGAFIGDTAKLFFKYYSPKLILAVEPERRNFDTLSALVVRWGLQEKIIPLRCVLSDSIGVKTFWGEGVGASVIKKSSKSEVFSEKVKSSTIDALVVEHKVDDVGLIKLDVEGNEMSAVIGAKETIKRDKPLLVISIYHTALDFFEIKPFIERMELGYRFIVRKITDDLLKELVLICMPDRGEV